jgi:hypothetical protein
LVAVFNGNSLLDSIDCGESVITHIFETVALDLKEVLHVVVIVTNTFFDERFELLNLSGVIRP